MRYLYIIVNRRGFPTCAGSEPDTLEGYRTLRAARQGLHVYRRLGAHGPYRIVRFRRG